jgi:hypothetical protein
VDCRIAQSAGSAHRSPGYALLAIGLRDDRALVPPLLQRFSFNVSKEKTTLMVSMAF